MISCILPSATRSPLIYPATLARNLGIPLLWHLKCCSDVKQRFMPSKGGLGLLPTPGIPEEVIPVSYIDSAWID